MNRTQAREQAFIFIFEYAFQPSCTMQQIIDTYNEIGQAAPAESDYQPASTFAKRLALGVEKQLPNCDNIIEKYAIGWKLNRLPKVTLSLLRLALYEMGWADEIPVSVTINEVIELAKKYSTKEDASFINGVLGAYSRSAQEVNEK